MPTGIVTNPELPRMRPDAPNSRPWRETAEEQVLLLAASGQPPSKISRELALRTADVEAFLKLPDSRDRIAEKHSQVIAALAGQLLDASGVAVSTLRATMEDVENTPRIRIDAARYLLDFTLRINEHHLLGNRVDEMNRKLRELAQQQPVILPAPVPELPASESVVEIDGTVIGVPTESAVPITDGEGLPDAI